MVSTQGNRARVAIATLGSQQGAASPAALGGAGPVSAAGPTGSGPGSPAPPALEAITTGRGQTGVAWRRGRPGGAWQPQLNMETSRAVKG